MSVDDKCVCGVALVRLPEDGTRVCKKIMIGTLGKPVDQVKTAYQEHVNGHG